MKLLTTTTLYFLAVMIPLLAITGFYLFSRFSTEINNRSDNELVSDELEWIQYIESEAENGTTFILRTPDIAIYPTDATATENPTLADVYSVKENSKIPYRQLSQVVAVGAIH